MFAVRLGAFVFMPAMLLASAQAAPIFTTNTPSFSSVPLAPGTYDIVASGASGGTGEFGNLGGLGAVVLG